VLQRELQAGLGLVELPAESVELGADRARLRLRPRGQLGLRGRHGRHFLGRGGLTPQRLDGEHQGEHRHEECGDPETTG
jgi:hypothetical protein